VGRRFLVSSLNARRRLEHDLREGAFDVVHVSLSFSDLDFGLPALCERLSLPLVATLHAPFDTRLTRWGGLSRVLYHIYSVPLRAYDAVVVFGARQRDLLTACGVRESRIRIVPNAVDTEFWSPGPPRSPLAPPTFIYLGRVDPEKNVGALLEAFASLDDERARLVIVGDGVERAQLERRYPLPSVTWTGARSTGVRRSLLRESDVFVLPSAIEGLSLALLEAMSCGVCPVASDVGCDGEAVAGCGLTLDPSSLDSDLRFAMRTLAGVPSLARQMGAMARRRALERYGLEANVQALLGIYRELGERRHRPTTRTVSSGTEPLREHAPLT
jgi:glycosyltransferase involved in cell wall biosynthesis